MKTHFLFFFLLSTTSILGQTIRYVKVGGGGAGTSWIDASGNLQQMINISNANDIIFVASGTYYPTVSANSSNPGLPYYSFLLKANIKIYGGFGGFETSLNQRILNPDNPSILSGDVDKNDFLTNGISTFIYGTNSRHVVIAVGEVGSLKIDGFTITGGEADFIGGLDEEFLVNGFSIKTRNGGGLYIDSASPQLHNCQFIGNKSLDFGAGIYTTNSSASIYNTHFSKNVCINFGGGICNYSSNSIVVNNCEFLENYGGSGGGIYNYSTSSNIENCNFSRNKTSNYRGGSGTSVNHGFGGGLYDRLSPDLSVTNCLFEENTALDGGGAAYSQSLVLMSKCTIKSNNTAIEGYAAYGWGGGGILLISTLDLPIKCRITDCIISGNKSPGFGGGLSSQSDAIITDCIFSGNKAKSGAGIFNYFAGQTFITNCTFSGNNATDDEIWYIAELGGAGGAVGNAINSSANIRNCISYGNSSEISNLYGYANVNTTVSYSLIRGGYAAGTSIIDSNPLFSNAPTFETAPFAGGDYHISLNSPALNAGNKTVFDAGQTPDLSAVIKDLEGANRVSYCTVDIGVYESTSNFGCPPPCLVLQTLVSPTDNINSGVIEKKASATNGKIQASNQITGTANVTYQAKSILLSPNFKADAGTVFKAEIGGCN
ncbi:3-coathanger stack domain-containing protein [Emticicia sp. BO119]|uniref:3-coathanger stack domain-containing protein n=1 Tax=Emticicia sp. BO119 TaxID=2757768 RepID=UPI0015F094AA|nr:3-coathanger stack domain-containing protein [Emticicia sp. BO119]MBA4850284.1 right-handed parallel beta-helix repeat-containing protein [Emticicia sp. BO119]